MGLRFFDVVGELVEYVLGILNMCVIENIL